MFSRWRPRLTIFASAFALAACPVLAGTGAEAAPAPRAGLPPIGAEVPSPTFADNAQFEYNGALIGLDFRGGIRQRVEANPNDPDRSVLLKTTGFQVNADVHAEEDDPRRVVIENDTDTDPKSTLTLTRNDPPRYEERDVIPVIVRIEFAEDTVVLKSKEPMVLHAADLTQYPPNGNTYSLEKPVELVEADHPDKVVGTLHTFPSRRGGL